MLSHDRHAYMEVCVFVLFVFLPCRPHSPPATPHIHRYTDTVRFPGWQGCGRCGRPLPSTRAARTLNTAQSSRSISARASLSDRIWQWWRRRCAYAHIVVWLAGQSPCGTAQANGMLPKQRNEAARTVRLPPVTRGSCPSRARAPAARRRGLRRAPHANTGMWIRSAAEADS